MAAINPVGFGGGDTAALPVQPQNGASFAPVAAPVAPAVVPQNNSFVPPVVTNNTNVAQAPANVTAPIPVPQPQAPIAPAVMAAAAKAPVDVTAGAVQPPIPQAPIVQNAQNGYMPGPQQVQNSDGQTNNVHFGEIGYDPFANAITKGANTAWK